MADFADLGTISNDVGFRQRCLIAANVQAVYIMNNAPSVPAQMETFCQSVLSGSISGTEFAIVAVANPTIAGEAEINAGSPGWNIADADIQTAMSQAWNAMAGIAAN